MKSPSFLTSVDYNSFTVSLPAPDSCPGLFINTSLRNGTGLHPHGIVRFMAEVYGSAAWRPGRELDTRPGLCWVPWAGPEADCCIGSSRGDVSAAKAAEHRARFSPFRIPFATTFLSMTRLSERPLPMAKSPFGPFTPVPIAT